jgi:Glycosyltransferase like family 2
MGEGLAAVERYLDSGLVCSALATALAVLALTLEHTLSRPRLPRWVGAAPPVLALPATMAVTRDWASALPAAVTVAIPVLAAAARLRSFRAAGASLLAAHATLLAFGILWSAFFVVGLPVSTLTRALMAALLIAALPVLPVHAVRGFENLEALCRREWRRHRACAPAVERRECMPRVSIHVPVHAEPPDVVAATLDSLARLDYADYEVLVIDNNTRNPALWRPVEAHCRELGERFRFFHVEALEGAKAGALNFGLCLTDSAAELVAVVDSDYQVAPEFLAELVPMFANAKLGFVQAPHAYREYEHSTYARMCAWEYGVFFATEMVSLDEGGAGITVGTMSLIRRDALEQAGGWAQWCLTEDSELAIRIHALGYTSCYVTTVYGRGLIPETFADYKAQRFRWTYGPVQELRRHLPLFLNLPRHRRLSRLTRWQRIHHATHGLYGVALALGCAALPLGLAILVSMALHQERVRLPFELWLAATVLLGSGLMLRWLAYTSLLGARFRDMLGAMVASASLTHVILSANVLAVLGRKASWRRTPKFKPSTSTARVMASTRAETALAAGCLAAAALPFVALRGSGLALFIGLGFVLQALTYLSAPLMAFLARRALRPDPAPARGPRDTELVDALPAPSETLVGAAAPHWENRRVAL